MSAKIINPKPIAILLAAYNGEKYLREQIDSIRMQTFTGWTLYIQDDGSSDNTVAIIDEYANNYENIICIDRGLSRMGPQINFMSQLSIVESEYYMFCDQDDVWLPEKIALSLAEMQKTEAVHPGRSVLVHTDYRVVDENLNVLLASYWNPRQVSPEKLEKKIKSLAVPDILAIYSIVAGCTAMFNHQVKAVAFPFPTIRMHDSWIAMKTADHGVISQVFQPTMLYRQHAANTCKLTLDNRLWGKIKKLRTVCRNNMKGYHIWKMLGKGSFFRFLYYRVNYFLILRLK